MKAAVLPMPCCERLLKALEKFFVDDQGALRLISVVPRIASHSGCQSKPGERTCGKTYSCLGRSNSRRAGGFEGACDSHQTRSSEAIAQT